MSEAALSEMSENNIWAFGLKLYHMVEQYRKSLLRFFMLSYVLLTVAAIYWLRPRYIGLMMLGIGICLYVLSEIIFFTIFRERHEPPPRRSMRQQETIVSIDCEASRTSSSAKRTSMKLLKPTLESIIESQELCITQKRDTWHFEPFESIQNIDERSEECSGFIGNPEV